MKKIIFLTNYKNIIPQRSNEIEGLKLNIISDVLEAHGFHCEEMTINEFVLLNLLWTTSFLYLTEPYSPYKRLDF